MVEVRTKLPLGKALYEMADQRPAYSVNHLIEFRSFKLAGKALAVQAPMIDAAATTNNHRCCHAATLITAIPRRGAPSGARIRYSFAIRRTGRLAATGTELRSPKHQLSVGPRRTSVCF